MSKITVFAVDDTAGLVVRDSTPYRYELKAIELDTAELKRQLEELLNDFVAFSQPEGNFTVSEIELALTVSAKGGISLIGKIEAGAEAGIKVKIAPRSSGAA